MLIIPTTEAKPTIFLGSCKFSEIVSPHSCILPGTAGLWPMATGPGTLPQGLFPQALIIQIAHLIVLWRGLTRHMATQHCTGKGKNLWNTEQQGNLVYCLQASKPPGMFSSRGQKGHCSPISCQQDTSPGLSQLEAPYSQYWALALRQKCWSAIQRVGNHGKGNGKR